MMEIIVAYIWFAVQALGAAPGNFLQENDGGWS